jgi:hypothetical protein
MTTAETSGAAPLSTLVTVGGPHLLIHCSTDGGSIAADSDVPTPSTIDIRDPIYRVELLHPHDPKSAPALKLEADVFCQSFGLTMSQFLAAYEPYESGSLFFSVTDTRRNEVQGVSRIIVQNPAGFMSVHDTEKNWGLRVVDLQELGLAPDSLCRTWDVATLAVAPRARQGEVSMALYQSMLMTLTAIGIDWLVSIQDIRVFRMLQSRLDNMFEPWPSACPKSYLGSVCIPVFFWPDEYRIRLQRDHPSKHRRLYHPGSSENLVRFDPHCDEVQRVLTAPMSRTAHMG